MVLARIDEGTLSQVVLMMTGARTAYDVTDHISPAGFAAHRDAVVAGSLSGVPAIPSKTALSASPTLVHISTSGWTKNQIPAALAAYLKGA